MKNIKLIVSVTIFVVLLVYCIAFAAHNSTSINIDFLAGTVISLPLPVWMLIFFCSGMLVSFVLGFYSRSRQRLKLGQLQKQLDDARQRLNKIS